MANTTQPLTNTQVERSKPRDTEYKLGDGHGLFLAIKPSGKKTWIFNYQRPITKRRNNLSFGAYPEVGLKLARDLRAEARALLAIEVDPKEYREQQNEAAKVALESTFYQIATTWFTVKKTSVSHDYAEDIWRSLELHIFPSVGGLPIDRITAPLVIKAIKQLESKGALETVKRLCQRVNEIMIFATNTGIATTNPLTGISVAFPKPAKIHLPAISPHELPLLLTRLEQAQINHTTRLCILWQLHTMVRPSEATGAKWIEIDLINRVWRIPAERTKTKRNQHQVPLTKQTIAILNELKRYSGRREHLFPGERNPNRGMNPQSPNMAIKRMGMGGRLVAHGLRTIASTTLNEEGWESDLIEAALSHVGKNEVRNAYNRTDYLERRRPLMEYWSKHIDRCRQSGSPKITSIKRFSKLGTHNA